MNALDANVLVRWIANDESARHQTLAVEAMLAETEGMLHVNLLVLAETIWVLDYTYRVDRAGIVTALRALLGHPRLRIERRPTVEAALAAYESGGPGLADHLIGELNAEAGCSTTLTFDKRAARSPHFTLLV